MLSVVTKIQIKDKLKQDFLLLGMYETAFQFCFELKGRIKFLKNVNFICLYFQNKVLLISFHNLLDLLMLIRQNVTNDVEPN